MAHGSLPWAIRPIDPATHAPLWAQPGFDDSQWETVDLTPQGVLDPLGGFSDYVKGWTARGHAGYSGYAWYRIRVQVAAQPGEKLALAGPSVCRRCLSTLQRWNPGRQLR